MEVIRLSRIWPWRWCAWRDHAWHSMGPQVLLPEQPLVAKTRCRMLSILWKHLPHSHRRLFCHKVLGEIQVYINCHFLILRQVKLSELFSQPWKLDVISYRHFCSLRVPIYQAMAIPIPSLFKFKVFYSIDQIQLCSQIKVAGLPKYLQFQNVRTVPRVNCVIALEGIQGPWIAVGHNCNIQSGSLENMLFIA